MFHNSLKKYGAVHPVRLHYIYGTNCYQHAIGYPDPVLTITDKGQGSLGVVYLMITPPDFSKDGKRKEPEEFSGYVMACCEEDGIINLKGNFEQRKRYRTLAVFTGKDIEGLQDMHFAFLNDQGKWEDKTPCGNVHLSDSTTEIEKRKNYKFRNYALSPIGIKPKCLEPLKIRTLVLESGGVYAQIAIAEHFAENAFIEGFVFNRVKNIAANVFSQEIVPLPYLSTGAMKLATPAPAV